MKSCAIIANIRSVNVPITAGFTDLPAVNFYLRAARYSTAGTKVRERAGSLKSREYGGRHDPGLSKGAIERSRNILVVSIGRVTASPCGHSGSAKRLAGLCFASLYVLHRAVCPRDRKSRGPPSRPLLTSSRRVAGLDLLKRKRRGENRPSDSRVGDCRVDAFADSGRRRVSDSV